MAWPSDRTQPLGDIYATTMQHVLSSQYDLVFEGEERWLQVAARRGAILPAQGGDQIRVGTCIASGETSKEYKASADNPSATLSATGEQTLADAFYDLWTRTKNMNINQSHISLNGRSALAFQSLVAKKGFANLKGIFEEYLGSSTDPGGIWAVTDGAITPDNGLMNLLAMYVDRDSDIAGVDVSTYTNFLPVAVTASDTSGAGILDDLQDLIVETTRDAEGMATDIFTNKKMFNKIVSIKNSKSVASTAPPNVDFGAKFTTEHAQVPIHWSHHAPAASTYWNSYTTGATASEPFVAVDFNSLALFAVMGGGFPGDEFSLVHQVLDTFLHPTAPFTGTRMEAILSHVFRTSRRTGGNLGDLSAVA